MTDTIATLFLTSIGLTCVYAGYRLFCGLPAVNGSTTRSGVLLLNVIPGILLALAGAGLLTAQASGAFSHKPAIRRQFPAPEGASWSPALPKHVSGASVVGTGFSMGRLGASRHYERKPGAIQGKIEPGAVRQLRPM